MKFIILFLLLKFYLCSIAGSEISWEIGELESADKTIFLYLHILIWKILKL